jgi:hypothetical protein
MSVEADAPDVGLTYKVINKRLQILLTFFEKR